jgi:hypothetical protein
MTSKTGNISVSKAARLSNEDGKTLSKNALYTPLNAYDQTAVEPSNYMASQSAIPKYLQESSLVEFLRSVSVAYHRTYVSVKAAKNGGSRPLSLFDVNDRIRQRAVSLLGGGIHAAVKPNNSQAPRQGQTSSRRQRRKRGRANNANVDISQKKQKLSSNEQIHFLRGLNTKWNEYISNVLELEENTSSEVILGRAASVMGQVDLVGAHLRIVKCTQKHRLEGKTGVLVDISKNTWKVAVLKSVKGSITHSNDKNTNNLSEEPTSKEGTSESIRNEMQLLVIPKRGSSLVLLIPAHAATSRTSDRMDRNEGDDVLISTADQTICIVLDPDQQS